MIRPMKLAILSDVHLSTPDSQFPDQDLTYAGGVLERAVARIVELDPDRVIVNGDLVNMGTPAEYAAARQLLTPLAGKIDALPGNHELVKADLADFEREMNQPPIGRSDPGGLTVVRLNTAVEGLTPHQWFGRLDADSVHLLNAVLEEDVARPLLIFCHHPVAGTVRLGDHPMMAQIHGEELLARLHCRRGPTVLFTGHTHVADVTRHRHVTCVGCPPLGFWPHAFLVAEFDGTHLSVRTERVIDSPEQSPDEKITHDGYRDAQEPTVPAFTLRL